ncbi:hypothetical protein [Exiguobacterium flavidum]|uniref:hypothetical protein n=1 Tax=Exiguobacterium flavidum TaxID=2184695 RepID=UPI0013007792|nr:hypothetical protein [Exiguobacterium flavidum]
MRWLTLSEPERKRIHPLNVALYVFGMLSLPFLLAEHAFVLLIAQLLLLHALHIRFEGKFYLPLVLTFLLVSAFPLLQGGFVDWYGVFLTGTSLLLFVSTSQLAIALAPFDQLAAMFRVFPRMTDLAGKVVALVPSLLKTWPEVRSSHGKGNEGQSLERTAIYHLLPVRHVLPEPRPYRREDITLTVVLVSLLYLIGQGYLFAGLLLPPVTSLSKGAIRDGYHLFSRRSRTR